MFARNLNKLFLMALLICPSSAWATYTLIDPSATAATQAMYTKITNYIGAGQTALGQHVYDQDPSLRSPDWYAVSNTYPLYMEWDWGDNFRNYTSPQSIPYMPEPFIDAMKLHYAHGGIVGVFWQMNNFSSTASGNKTSYDLTGNTTARILPAGADRAAYLAQLQAFANFCKAIQIPMVVHTLHENDGTFFWWGSSATSDGNYVSLYQDFVTQMEAMGVHNLIYLYSPQLVNGYTTYKGARFPGSTYVDIYGIDRYFGQDDSSVVANDIAAYATASTAASGDTKPYAVTEGFYDQLPANGQYSASNWTTLMAAFEADANAKKAVYFAFWTNSPSNWYGPVLGNGDNANFNTMLSTYTNLLTLAPYNGGFDNQITYHTVLSGNVRAN